MNSPLTIQEIMSTSKGTFDATFKGVNWRVLGTLGGTRNMGFFSQLVFNPQAPSSPLNSPQSLPKPSV